jgi:hypothetical protein
MRNLATLRVMGLLLEAVFDWLIDWLMPPWFGRRKRRRRPVERVPVQWLRDRS